MLGGEKHGTARAQCTHSLPGAAAGPGQRAPGAGAGSVQLPGPNRTPPPFPGHLLCVLTAAPFLNAASCGLRYGTENQACCSTVPNKR